MVQCRYEEAVSGDGASQRIPAAVHTKRHNIRFVEVDVPDFPSREPHIIEVDSNPLPIVIQFKSASSQIRVEHSHKELQQQPKIQETKSEDQPQHLRHEVIKPIIQEVHEIVKPYRRVIQEIRPVVQEIETIVAKKKTGVSGDSIDPGFHPVKDAGAGIVGSVNFDRFDQRSMRSVGGQHYFSPRQL